MESAARWRLYANAFQKIVSFLFNQLLIRWTNPEVFGFVAIQLELLLSTLLFLSREGLRMTVLRTEVSNKNDYQLLINLSWLPSSFVALAIGGLFYCNRFVKTLTNTTSVLLYALGALFESLGEPWFNLFQHQLRHQPRLAAEMSAVFARSSVAFAAIALYKWGPEGFAIGQCCYGLVYWVTLVSYTSAIQLPELDCCQVHDMLPRLVQVKSGSGLQFLSPGSLYTAAVITFSSLLKHMLTEADKIALTLFYSPSQQGIFAFANNYGSLVARMLFMPAEEASRLAFAKSMTHLRGLLTANSGLSSEDTDGDTGDDAVLVSAIAAATDQLYTVVSLLQTALLFGWTCVVFGPPYVRLLINILVAKMWRTDEMVSVLSSYCLYLLVLGCNGISEGFVQTVCRDQDFSGINLVFVLSSIVYVVSGFIFSQHVGLGTSGLVLASAASMLTRIVFNFLYIESFFTNPVSHINLKSLQGSQGIRYSKRLEALKVSFREMKHPLRKLLPNMTSVVVSIIICFTLHYSAYRFVLSRLSLSTYRQHLSVGALAAALFLYIFLFVDSNYKNLRTKWLKLLPIKNNI